MKVGAKTKARKGAQVLTKAEVGTLVLGTVGLTLGRVAVFGVMNPILIAFLASYLKKGQRLYAIALMGVVGLLTRFEGMAVIKYLVAVLLIVGANFVFELAKVQVTRLTRGSVAAVAVLVPGLVVSVATHQLYPQGLVTGLEGALAFVLVYLMEEGLLVLEGKKTRLGSEAMLSSAIVFGAVVAGVADVYIGLFSLKIFVCTLLVLMMAHKGKAQGGAMAGILLGLILKVTGSGTGSEFIVILSVAGMMAGIGQKTYTQGLGFVLGGFVMAMYLDVAMLDLMTALSVAVAMGVFLMTPKNIGLKQDAITSQDVEKTRAYMSQKLVKYAGSFDKLAQTFESISEKKYTLDKEDAPKLIDEVANKTCVGCERRETCWGSEFYKTYEVMFSLIGQAQRKGNVDRLGENANFCSAPDKLLTNINRTFDLYRSNMQWENKIAESRELVAGQLKGVGQVLKNIVGELESPLQFFPELEEKIEKTLARQKIGGEIEGCTVVLNHEKKYEVTLKQRHRRKVSDELIHVVSEVLDKKMTIDTSVMETKAIRLIEDTAFRVFSGIAKVSKERDKVSGDSYSAMTHIGGSKCLLLLSDGMGSGDRARLESGAALDMFEDFLETGFDKETAIQMINSVLVLKSNEDSFSTLDVCSVDLHTGVSEFIKMGASSTYLLRGGMVQVVKNTALPMGILNSVEVDVTTKRLKADDLIIMVTDGVTEGKTNNEKEERLINLLSDTKETDNPQALAQDILAQIQQSSGVLDDMTVMVAKVVAK